MTDDTVYERFTIKEKITMMVNRYEIRSAEASEAEGGVIAMRSRNGPPSRSR